MSERKYLYILAGIATRKTEVRTDASLAVLRSDSEALGEALLAIKEKCPEEEGWKAHQAQAPRISDELILWMARHIQEAGEARADQKGSGE